jgi:hypothetical protein
MDHRSQYRQKEEAVAVLTNRKYRKAWRITGSYRIDGRVQKRIKRSGSCRRIKFVEGQKNKAKGRAEGIKISNRRGQTVLMWVGGQKTGAEGRVQR